MKKKFVLDKRLEKDCYRIGFINSNLLLLMDNALIPWFILVPDTNVREFYELEYNEQLTILDSTNLISAFLKNDLGADKINVAAIGNVVSQLHIHIVGRRTDDHCWPNVVWGSKESQRYSVDKLEQLKSQIKQTLKEFLTG